MSTRSIGSLLVACAAAALCGCGHSGSTPVSTLPDPLAAGWEGNPVCQQLAKTDKQRVLKCTFAPGVGHERHYHVPHVGYALSGGRMRLTDDSGTREVELATGSHYTSDGTPWHEVFNIGQTTVQYLIIESLPP